MRWIPIVLAIAVFPAQAQEGPKCGPAADVQKALKEKFNETMTGMGPINPQTVLELFQSPDGKTWTIVQTDVSGKSCVMAYGKGWVSEQPKDGGKGI